ncbi:PRD domain-containing protein [Paenibacillus chitinolyticus]|uniref:PRD domain-containing protein n=1 Tax=Paenibacillus TaxID=44249 RepID=UPI001C2FCDAF|nr:PRD domain-containing protein [Paenibacillus sp. GbtcB18]
MIQRKIIHVLSHNVVMTKLSTGKNSIAFGKGIGFKKQPGMIIEDADISQEFLLHTSEVLEHYEHILHAVDVKIIGITEEVIAYAQGHLEGEFSETIHAALVDHINFAVERCKRGVHILNPFAYEIKHLYEEEYRIASKAIDFLNQHLDVRLPDDEIAFLAMHFHTARTKVEKGTALAVVRLVAQVIERAKELGLDFDNSFSTVRFISHLKALIDRIMEQKTIRNPLLGKISEEYPLAFQKAVLLAELLKANLQKPIPMDEIGFLALHLERQMQRSGMD